MTQKLPKFKKPPIIETALGVEFSPIRGWQVPHFGLFYDQIREEYPKFSVQPPLPEQIEKFDNERSVITIDLGADPEVRCWFFDNQNNWLLQIQNNRFISNWKGDYTSYPHYTGFKDTFDAKWNAFNEFIGIENLGDIEILQAEVTYINHIEIGTNLDDLSEIFSVWAGFHDNHGFLPKPEAVAFKSVFVIPENQGRLYINMQPVIRHADVKTVFQLSLTAKVKVASKEELGTAFAVAHEWVVRGFADFTSDKMHELWNRYDNK